MNAEQYFTWLYKKYRSVQLPKYSSTQYKIIDDYNPFAMSEGDYSELIF